MLSGDAWFVVDPARAARQTGYANPEHPDPYPRKETHSHAALWERGAAHTKWFSKIKMCWFTVLAFPCLFATQDLDFMEMQTDATPNGSQKSIYSWICKSIFASIYSWKRLLKVYPLSFQNLLLDQMSACNCIVSTFSAAVLVEPQAENAWLGNRAWTRQYCLIVENVNMYNNGLWIALLMNTHYG